MESLSSAKLKPIAIALSLVTAPAVFAQDSGSKLEEIIVTGERTGERNLQEVPIAISAVSSDDITALGIQDFGDIGYVAPNVSAMPQPGDTAAPAYAIRGITTGSLEFGVDSGVGLYLDGVYIGRAPGSSFAVAEIERIEILRGPQSTLYGRNTTGGAISMVTRKPSDEFGFEQRVTAGNYGLFEARTVIDTGEYNGWKARLTYLHSEHDGYFDNSRPGIRTAVPFPPPGVTVESVDELAADDTDAVGLAVTWTASDSLVFDYRFDYTDTTSTQRPHQLTTAGGDIPGLLAGSIADGGTGFVSQDSSDKIPASFMGEYEYEIQGHSLTIDFDISDTLALKSITGYRDMDNVLGGNDPDGNDIVIFGTGGLGLELFSGYREREQDQFSQEFHLLGNHDTWNWLVGVYYYEEDGEDVGANYPGGLVIGGVIPPDTLGGVGAYETSNESQAIFGQATFDLTDKLSLIAGLRYTEDDRELNRIIFNPTHDSESFDHTDGNVTLFYSWNEDINTYLKYSTGYLSGGFANGLDNFNGSPLQFDEEELESWEIGMKGEFFDSRVRLNLAAFYSDYTDMQVQQFTNGQLIIVNAGEAEVNGFELEMDAAITDNLIFKAAYGYQDFDIKELFLAPGFDAADFGAERVNTPESNAILSLNYSNDTAWGLLTARIDAAWRDEIVYSVLPPTTAERKKALTSDDMWLLNARIAISEIQLGDRSTLEVAAWGRNLTDEDEKTWGIDFGDFTNAQFMDPRTYGLDVTYRF